MPMFTSTQPRQTDSDNILLAKIAQALADDNADFTSITTLLQAGNRGTPNFTSVAVTTTTGPTLISAARSTRRYAVIKNTDSAATNSIYIGASGVAVSTGMELKPGQSIVWESTAAIYAIASGASVDTRVVEFYD